MKKQVSKEEFEEFISSYPNELTKNINGIFEPPLITYNDFSNGIFPDSAVAWIHFFENYPKDGKEPYRFKENEYFINEVKMTITNERLQELLARASLVESIEISKENMDEYREILRMAMELKFRTREFQISGF